MPLRKVPRAAISPRPSTERCSAARSGAGTSWRVPDSLTNCAVSAASSCSEGSTRNAGLVTSTIGTFMPSRVRT